MPFGTMNPRWGGTGVRGAGLGLNIGNLEQITHTQPAKLHFTGFEVCADNHGLLDN